MQPESGERPDTGFELHIEITDKIGGGLSDRLWELVSDGFEDLNRNSILKQDMTKPEFLDDLLDETVIKFVTFENNDGETPLALGLVHTTPETVTWVNAQKLRQVYAEPIAAGTFQYAGSIVTKKDRRSLHNSSQHTAQLMAHLVEESHSRGMPAFVGLDYCSANDPALPRYLQWVFDKYKIPVRNLELTKQLWCHIGIGDDNRTTTGKIEYERDSNIGEDLGLVELSGNALVVDCGDAVVVNSGVLTRAKNLESTGLFNSSFLSASLGIEYLNGANLLFKRPGGNQELASLFENDLSDGRELLLDIDIANLPVLKSIVSSLPVREAQLTIVDHHTYSVFAEAT